MTASTDNEESSMTPEQRLAYLLEVVSVPSNRGRLTHSWVAENISLAVADAVFAAIDSQSKPTALRFAAGDGIDTAAALWKQQAEAVAAGNPLLAPHLAELRDFELVQRVRWQALGYSQAPTLETITAELEAETLATAARERLARISNCRQAFDRVAAEVRGRIESGVTDGGQISAAFDSAWSMAWPH